LSMMCSDSTDGPPNLMALRQLVPENLAVSIKESIAAATVAGGAAVGSGGVGQGAAGAGGESSLGEAVRVFDGDHETPELIWDGVCRHELRRALGQIGLSLTKARQRAGKEGKPGGADGCP